MRRSPRRAGADLAAQIADDQSRGPAIGADHGVEFL